VSNPVFLCADLSADRVVVDGPEGRHAATVKRLRVGEPVDLVDGEGTRCTCVVVSATKDTVTCDVVTRVLEAPPSPTLTLVQALAKGDRGELAVELATEVGVDAIRPWAAARCQLSGDGRQAVAAGTLPDRRGAAAHPGHRRARRSAAGAPRAGVGAVVLAAGHRGRGARRGA
jgi:16S rRNA (uracil1498-N3)-methyltransferase